MPIAGLHHTQKAGFVPEHGKPEAEESTRQTFLVYRSTFGSVNLPLQQLQLNLLYTTESDDPFVANRRPEKREADQICGPGSLL
jgi:hypothetical protein